MMDGPCLGHDLDTQCQYEHDTKRAAHLNTTATHLNMSTRLQAAAHLKPAQYIPRLLHTHTNKP
jgi:hypothetical protein